MSDKITEVEQHGIAPIPPAEQTSRPRDLFRIAFGGANTFATIILDTLPIARRLSSASTATGSCTYALGTFWPTFTLAALTALANPISFGAFLGDWSRYIPDRYRKRSLLAAAATGSPAG